MTETPRFSSKKTLVDPEDVREAARGNHVAFARLVEACAPMVSAVTRSMLFDREWARDVAQEAFLHAWRDLDRLQAPEAFVAWLRQIARNLALIHLRSRSRRPADHAGGDPEGSLATAVDEAPDSAQVVERVESMGVLREAIGGLPQTSREVMILFYAEEMSVREIASQLGLREAAVKQRLSRGRRRVHQDVLARFGEPIDAAAPDRRFTAAVLAACERADAAAGLGLSLAALTKVLPGILMGSAGVLFGFWLNWRRARDDAERRGLLWLTAINLVAAAAFPLALAEGGKVSLIIALAVFMGIMAWANLLRLPTIIAGRQALERIEDPKAERRHQIHRALSLSGLALGSALGLWAIFVSERPW